MPTVSQIVEAFDGRQGSEDDSGRRRLIRVFRVQFDSINVGYSYALYAPGIPVRFAAYEGPFEADPGCRAVSRNAVQDSSDPFWWTVTVEYDSISRNPALSQGGTGQGGEPVNENPLLDPPDIVWGAIHDSVPARVTVDDPPRLITNSAEEPYTPKPQKDFHRPSLTYTRNEGYSAFLDSNYYTTTFWDCINEASFSDFQARQLKFNYHTAQLQYRNHTPFWRVTYYFEARYPTWDLYLVDLGSKVKDANGKLVASMTGPIPDGEVLLDGFGHKFTPTLTQPCVILPRYRIYRAFDFTELGLTGL